MFERLKSLLRWKKKNPEIAEVARKQHLEHLDQELEKHERMFSIRERNLERQRNTLGSGLKSRNFRPRPAHEKKVWKLDKKPED